MTFRVNNIKKYQQCPKHFLLDYTDTESGFPFIYFNESLVEAAKKYLKITDDSVFVGSVGQSSEDTKRGMEGKEWACLARFEAHNLRIKVSFLKKEDDGYSYYALCRTCYPKEDEARRLYIEKWLLEQEGIHITHVALIHLNALYERKEALDYSQLFCVSDTFYKDTNKPGKNVDEVLANYEYDIPMALEDMQRIVDAGECDNRFKLECTKHGKCSRYHDCFNEDELDDDSILFLNGTRKKYEMYLNGKTKITDVDFDTDIDGTYLQYAQYMACLYKREYVEVNALSSWLDSSLQYPYVFVDFEWDTIGIPMYENMKPYDVLVFQYSIHIDDGTTVEHKEFLGNGGDSREEFIQHLLQDIPDEGSIIAYHAEGAEKLRLFELAHQFPKYKEQLEALCARMVDLTYPIMNGLYYHPKMRGTYSLKRIYAVINNNHGYNELDIDHGLKAVAAYRNLPNLSEVERDTVRNELLEYCGMDTFAMVKLVSYLKQKVVERTNELLEKLKK